MTRIDELRQRLAKITRDNVSLGVGAGGFPLSKQKKKDFKYEDGYDLGTMREIDALRDTEPHETGGFDWQEGENRK